ncbi:unnamed protein product [Moneuplotes crassus]|uniref:Uncharacterized protein n=1 Tax=Euplotes crassus TaxID=5936 RepID=A0AAD1UBP4_EUPCR|nr:unnamed protein product [Moneuplotes crassus]
MNKPNPPRKQRTFNLKLSQSKTQENCTKIEQIPPENPINQSKNSQNSSKFNTNFTSNTKFLKQNHKPMSLNFGQPRSLARVRTEKYSLKKAGRAQKQSNSPSPRQKILEIN